MQDTILAKLESSRKELLDLGLRNPLINYKQQKSKGVHVVQEKSSSVFDLLVRQGKAMSFVGRPDDINRTQEIAFVEPTQDELQSLYTDTKLQTAETETTLQYKLLNTYYAARTSLEEQGVNTLYISLGMLNWYEAEASEEKRFAPLVLIPVSLERSSARERFRVRYSEEEIGHNLSLQAKLKAEFGLALPEFDTDDFVIDDYFAAVASVIKTQHRWQLIEDHIELGFFSFGKFMIYHDLDNSKWPENAKPVEHRLLQSLFQTSFQDPQPTAGDDAYIDRDTNAEELYQVVDADSSQILAMLAVHEGRNMVIQGPPGTGKSQTITNMIANAIGQGKKVLFVAEKMAALEVVKRRLDNIGLGEACLELHSHKTNKKELHHELKRVLELGKPSLQKMQEEVSLLSRHKEELNAYCVAVNTPIGTSGLTAHTVYGYLLTINEKVNGNLLPKIDLLDIEHWSAEREKAAEVMAERLEARLSDIGVPKELLFWGTVLRVLLPQEQETLKTTLNTAYEVLTKLKGTSEQIAQAMGFAPPVKREDVLELSTWAGVAAQKPDLSETAVLNKGWLLQKADIDEALSTGLQLSELRQKYADVLLPEAWELSVLEIRQSLKEHGAKWYKFLLSDYKAANKRLRAVCKEALPKELDQKMQYVEAILTSQRLQAALNEYDAILKELFGKRYQKQKTDWLALKGAAEYLYDVHQQLADGKCPAHLLDYLNRGEKPTVAQQYHDALLTALNEQSKAVEQVVKGLQLEEGKRFANGSFQHQPFDEQAELLSRWTDRLPEVYQAIAWNNLVDVAGEENLQCLTNAAMDWGEAKDHLRLALQKTWYEYLLQKAMTEHPALRKFERTSHEEVIKQFRQTDRLWLQYNRAATALKHWQGLPSMEGGGQVTILKTEFNKRARYKPIRALMQDAGHAIQAIKPVFMMSPLSIANFLAPGAIDFDLVVFDEASQVRPVESLGALLRGKQLVVVGDTKQLPPTSFFDTLNDNIEEEENVTVDIQSILGMCDSQGAPQKMLRWHYRSRHESLITLSNHEFYESRLVVFPSPGSRHRMGLAFHHLADTVYDRGGTRTNAMEAEIVAQAVMEHAKKYPNLSLGVVAFSSAQREAIANALETKRRAAPDLETFFKAKAEEPFFVKNLENVQGDERDVIFISIGYGRTKEGYVSMSFGPLNNEGGERRLNVLITRAKLRCEVFTNITAADIDTSKTQRRGIRALKSFLHFAQHGKLDVAEESGKPFDSPFEESVARALSALGYTVRQQVGSQGFYLDLAIVDPEHPGRYLLGIECDGAAYHSARSARDRDRLRQQVLEGIGWRIHRVWSTDWFRNPERELKRVVEAIERSKQAFYIDDVVEEDTVIEKAIEREELPEESITIPEYQTATLHPEIATKELHLHTIGKLAGWIEAIVLIESPVHFEEMARRMVEAAGITRLGSRIRSQLLTAARFAEGSRRIVMRGEFLWSPTMQLPSLRKRTNFPASSKKIKLIAPEELHLAVEKVVTDSIAIQPEAAVNLIAKLFGFQRVTEDMRQEILDAIRSALKEQRVTREGDVLKLR